MDVMLHFFLPFFFPIYTRVILFFHIYIILCVFNEIYYIIIFFFFRNLFIFCWIEALFSVLRFFFCGSFHFFLGVCSGFFFFESLWLPFVVLSLLLLLLSHYSDCMLLLFVEYPNILISFYMSFCFRFILSHFFIFLKHIVCVI